MGPCKECGEWHCDCAWTSAAFAYIQNEQHRHETLLQHRVLKARHDPAFQSFMAKVWSA
jgi:hypothetical protein